MGKNLVPPSGGDDNIHPVDLKAALEERYLAYALSTIMHRALPDVRDGLKPVHRRIVYAMSEMGLRPNSAFRKCAKIVGEVMGNYHPHGDQAIYDALARLAQDFSLRYPLVDGQGNFGNIDGDSPAAMRYTESKMTAVAELLLEGIGEDAVDFRDTYDESNSEPVVLPGAFPNLLANGASGIAVGMATSIPPHNAHELCDAALYLIKHPDATVEKLVEFIPGPDLPTGGVIVESRENILDAYKTGRGGFRVRAKWETEDLGRGGYQIVITEIPFQVQKSRLIEKIAELLIARKLPLLEDVRDESAEDVRIVLVPKSRTVDATLLMESLFRLSDLESRLPLNMNVLSLGKVPKVMALNEVLTEWLAHRKDVLVRRSRHRLAAIDRRLEILGGLLVAYLNLDEVIRIIREEDEPKQVMMAKWSLTDLQAESILNMRLRNLRKLEEFEIRKEFDELTNEKAEIEALIASDDKQWQTIAWEIGEVKKKYAKATELGRRRTQFADAPDADIEAIQQAMIEKEPVTIVISQKGWIRALKGHMSDTSTLTFKEGDGPKLAFPAQTTDKLLLLTTGGKAYTLGADKLPGGRGHGEPIRIMVDMENDQDVLTAFVHDPSRKLLLVSTAGNGFVVAESEMVANTRKGKQIMNVSMPDEAKLAVPVTGDHVAVVGENRKLLAFPLAQVPEMSRGKGVRLQRYKDGGVVDVKCFALADGLSWSDTAGRLFNKVGEELREWLADRATAGRTVPKGFPRSGKFGG
ncbi:DNA topoisomerase IV subunit A [Rhizobium pusense]|jgi:topoisomerase-4 subunit A|uniref:DNA topoisomerase 4 subunit A n=6 Tax=Pseudomonadota TaxID=1224 RepID=U4Q2Y3_9HYPH|nr:MULTISPECIES: DNA topoisomerase IV subunit A [Rhizobium/Agrobacterium group]AMD61391.1 DNA topoisomerase IV subunit A [Agrobacterium tumefaciens]AUC09445.1 DNA topoisomerase IV subunit A [Rhizobium sp. Y9]KIV69034.1 Topoisomerase IV subunit A [Rhizobium sp. UR51a]MBM7323775.1 DNA topoisomerase IV subunit A [Agrobacterium sp. S2]MDP9775897.1 topoisomerase-4 subunit A [Rhizobium sp. SORGH_AS_0755]OAI90119.1 DNA topoisomerase IV subunit A [Rhizobium sp. GHKF11]TGR67145.1 DNA topoisomerase IV